MVSSTQHHTNISKITKKKLPSLNNETNIAFVNFYFNVWISEEDVLHSGEGEVPDLREDKLRH